MATQARPSPLAAALRNRTVAGPLLTLAAVLLAEGLAWTVLADRTHLLALLYAIPISGVILAAMLGGLRAGLASAALAAPLAVHHYATRFEALFPRAGDRLLMGLGVGAFIVALAALVGILQDRSEAQARRALEAERRHSAEVEAKNAQLARANAALAEANEALESFSYVVSHDLKEPVRALNAFSRALEEDHGPALPADARDLAHRNVETSQRLARLLEGLLDFSRASRISPDERRPVRVEDAIASPDCVARFEHLLAERHARLTVLPGPAVLASVESLAQILGNLVLNALKHNLNAKPVVRVCSSTWREDPAFVEIIVEDNGPGFPPQVVQRFDALKQGRPSTVRGGFGLLIARRAAERLGGRMRLGKSPELGGAAVHVLLPAADAPWREEPEADDARTPRTRGGA